VFGRNIESPARKVPYPPVRFMTISDIHFLDPSLYDDGKAFGDFSASNDGKMLTEGPLVLKMIVKTAITEKPDFLLVTGDLTVNGAEASHRGVAEAFRTIEEAGIPVYVVPGNHDILNPWASIFDSDTSERIGGIDPDTFRKIYNGAGYGDAEEADLDTLSYIAEPIPGLRLLMLDSNLYEDNVSKKYPQTDGFFSPGQTRWIRNSLDGAAEEERAVIVGMHHSLLHHVGNGGGTMNSITVYNWPIYFEIFANAQASLVFTGHIHAQDTAAMAVPDSGGFVFDASTGAASIFPHSYRIVTIDGDTASYQAGRLTDMLPEEDRDAYIQRARSVYITSLVDRSAPSLAERNAVDEDDARVMMSYIAALSLNHFAGEEQGDLPEHLFPKARRLWGETDNGGAGSWLTRMGSDTPPKDNGIIVDLNTGMWKSE
jgi:3',5'-cyclic AMP phosphodiesterase CpdA